MRDARRGSLLVRRQGRPAPRGRTELRHAHAVEMGREGVPLIVIQRQLGHTNLRITSIYLQGIDNTEISTPSTPAARQGPRTQPAWAVTHG